MDNETSVTNSNETPPNRPIKKIIIYTIISILSLCVGSLITYKFVTMTKVVECPNIVCQPTQQADIDDKTDQGNDGSLSNNVTNKVEFIPIPNALEDKNIPALEYTNIDKIGKYFIESDGISIPYNQSVIEALNNIDKEFKCSQEYISDADIYSSELPTKYSENLGYKKDVGQMKGDDLIDISMINFINRINEASYDYNQWGSTIYTIQECLFPEDPETLISHNFYIYTIQGSGGGAGLVSYIQSKYDEYPIAVIYGNGAYGSCDVLFGDTTYNVYFDCSGGDGGGGSAEIKRVNITGAETIQECTTWLDDIQCE